MTIEERASGFVSRADAALGDLGRAVEIWEASVGSKSDEMRLHSLSVDLDNAIRKVSGKFDAWAALNPSRVEAVAENGPMHLFWVISAHPSGRVREAFVHNAKHVHSDQILPHMANRSIDFVPEIRQLASPLVMARLGEILGERVSPGNHGVLPTSAHIALKKLLMPRTAVVSPELIRICIDLAETSNMTRPGSLSEGKLDRMLERCRQTLASNSDPSSNEAIEALIAYFNENAISN